MEDKKSMCKRCMEIPSIFRSIVSIDFTFKAPNIVEKIIWATIGIVGLFWVAYFVTYLVTHKNPITITSTDVKLSDLKYPAITICPKTANKFAIVERLGNYLNENSKELKNLLKIFALAITFLSKSTKNIAEDKYTKQSCKIENNDVCKV